MEIDIENYLARFRIHYPKSLFPPDFNALKEFNCPICFRRLYWNANRSVARCKSKQKDKFFIRSEVYNKILAK